MSKIEIFPINVSKYNGNAKVGKLVYQNPNYPGKIREILPTGEMVVEWMTKKRNITTVHWVYDFDDYVSKINKIFEKHRKTLDKIKNWA